MNERPTKTTTRLTCRTSSNSKNKPSKIEKNVKKRWDMMKNLENQIQSQIQRNLKRSSRLPNKLFEILKRTRKIWVNPKKKMIKSKKELLKAKRNQKFKKIMKMTKRSRIKWEWPNNSKCFNKWWWISSNQSTEDERLQPRRSESQDPRQQNRDGRKRCRHRCQDDQCQPQIERNEQANENEMKNFWDKDT